MAEEPNIEHFDLGTFVDYVYALKQERDALRAQLTSQGGEAVEVVGYGCEGQIEVLKHVPLTGGMKVSGREREKYNVPLMTVAQHQRILAAATHPADQVAEPDAELIELLRDAREFAAAYVSNSFFGANARKTLSRIDAKMASLEVKP